MDLRGLRYGLGAYHPCEFSAYHPCYPLIHCPIGSSSSSTHWVQVLGPILAKLLYVNPFRHIPLALWVTMMGTLGTLSRCVSKLSEVMLDVCGNVYLHMVQNVREVPSELIFPSDNLSGELSGSGDKLSKKRFSCPRKVYPHAITSVPACILCICDSVCRCSRGLFHCIRLVHV